MNKIYNFKHLQPLHFIYCVQNLQICAELWSYHFIILFYDFFSVEKHTEVEQDGGLGDGSRALKVTILSFFFLNAW